MSPEVTCDHAPSDGARLFVETTGSGTPIVFAHEFAGDLRNWEPQVRSFARRYRCIAFNARGYPPSDVPEDPALYSKAHAVEDIACVMRHCGVRRAHLVGLSMGGYAALNFGLAHPEMTRSIVAAGVGHGSDPETREQFLRDGAALAERLLQLGLHAGGAEYLDGPTRRRFREKDPRGCAEFKQQFAEHSALGSALTLRGCQLQRSTLLELGSRLAAMPVPTLVIAGDDDGPCAAMAPFLKRTIPDARLWIAPRTTHTVNLEEPEAFNRVVADFLAEVDARDGGA